MISRLNRYAEPLTIALAFALWFFLFRHFIFNELPLTNDAIAYFQHTRFYLLNLESGVYPLWDPDWFGGAPVDFFLRRIGNFNPLYLLIIVLHKVGIPFRIAYLLFLVIYFYLGMLGFYMLARTLIADRRAALSAFLLLCFSSLGTMLYFSFLHVVFVPLFWLFYFLIDFFKKPSRASLLGITFTLMIAVSTYIPFYTFIILCSFILFFAIFYPRALKNAIQGAVPYMARNKTLVFLCVMSLFFACLPQALLYKSSTDGQVALPSRHAGSAQESIYTVDTKKIAGGDAIAQLYFDRLLRDHDKMEKGIVYFPIAGYFIFLLGLFTKTDKRTILLALLAFFFFLITVTELSPVHGFLYKYFFVLKFIRQSYFFFWIAILPILAMIVGVQLEKLLSLQQHKHAPVQACVASAVFLGSFIYLKIIGSVSIVTYLVLVLCFALSLGIIFSSQVKGLAVLLNKPLVFLLALFAIIVMDPVDTLRQIKNNEEWTPSTYTFSEDEQKGALKFKDRNYIYESDKAWADYYYSNQAGKAYTRPTELYYASEGYQFLFQNIDYALFRNYLNDRFVLYDQLQLVKKEAFKPELIEAVLSFNDNRAIVEDERALTEYTSSFSGQPVSVRSATDQFWVSEITANTLILNTQLPSPKFLVYNDSFHQDWSVAINGQKRTLYRANTGFKGVWLPEGPSTVIFHFKPMARYLFDLLIAAIFASVLAVLLIFWYRERRTTKAGATTP